MNVIDDEGDQDDTNDDQAADRKQRFQETSFKDICFEMDINFKRFWIIKYGSFIIIRISAYYLNNAVDSCLLIITYLNSLNLFEIGFNISFAKYYVIKSLFL